MKVIIEPEDIVQGAEFVAPSTFRSGEFVRFLIAQEQPGAHALVNVSYATVTLATPVRETTRTIEDLLNRANAVPAWLHTAQEAEKARLAREAD